MTNPGEVIRTRRLFVGLSLRDLASCVGCSPSMMSDIELNRRTPSSALAFRIFFELTMHNDDRGLCVDFWTIELKRIYNEWQVVASRTALA